jgi:hypothetical protein
MSLLVVLWLRAWTAITLVPGTRIAAGLVTVTTRESGSNADGATGVKGEIASRHVVAANLGAIDPRDKSVVDSMMMSNRVICDRFVTTNALR